MLPVVTVGVMGLVGVVQRYRDTGALSVVVAHVNHVEQTLTLYAGLIDEKSASETIVIAAASGISSAEVSKLVGYDISAQLRRGRAYVDTAIANGDILGDTVTQLRALRARLDAGRASESDVRPFFIARIAAAETAWNADLLQLTQASLGPVGSPELRRAVAGLADSVAAFIAGGSATAAAGAMTAPNVPGSATGLPDLAASNALYRDATTRLGSELRGQAAAAQQRLIGADSDVRTFQTFVDSLIATPSGRSVTWSIPELGAIFRNGLLFLDHLRLVVSAAAAEVAPIAHRLQASAQRTLEQYLLALSLIAACSSALAIVTTRTIVRPLARLAARAARVSSGAIDDEVTTPDGPYEVALVTAAFNEIVANLSALDATTLALAAGDLENPALTTPVPGRIGDSLRHSVDRLHESIRINEELRQTLTISETRFREFADHSPDIVLHLAREPQLHIDYMSPSFEALTGIPAAAVEADLSLFADSLDHETRGLLAVVAAGGSLPPYFDATLRRADGSDTILEVRVVETPGGMQGVGRDVTAIRMLHAQLAQQATQDPLTGLANRRLFGELFGRTLSRANRSGDTVTVAFLDLDNFKSVNDIYGHDAGDIVLRVTATRLLTAVRGADIVARYGGDEFVVVSEAAVGSTDGQLAERIEDALGGPIDIGNGVTVRCSSSIGISDTRTTISDSTALVAAADHAMLERKRARRRTQPSTLPALAGDPPLARP